MTNKKAVKDKYKVAVVKREVEFSKETYNRAYNDFSQFIAANPTAEKMMRLTLKKPDTNCLTEETCIAQNTLSVV